jgi:hypothetical protein
LIHFASLTLFSVSGWIVSVVCGRMTAGNEFIQSSSSFSIWNASVNMRFVVLSWRYTLKQIRLVILEKSTMGLMMAQ